MRLIWALILLISCATEEYITIDTRPRGAQVLKKDNGDLITMGNTPVFVKEKRDEKEKYRFSFEDVGSDYIVTEKTFEKSERCQETWKDPILHPITKKEKEEAGYPFDVVIDSFQKECVPYIRAHLKKMKKQKTIRQCRKILVVFPKSFYRLVSHELVNHWKKNKFPAEMKFCDSLVDTRKSNVELMFDRKDNYNSPEKLEEMSFQNWARLGHKFKASHVVFFPYTEKDDEYSVTPTIVDLHTWEKEKKPSFTPFKKKIKISTGFKIGNFLTTGFRLIPNVFSLKLKMDSAFHLEDTSILGGDVERYSYTDLRWGFSVGSFRFPKKRWFGEFELGPRVSFTTWGKENRFYVTEASIALRFFLHSPIGAVLNVKAYAGGAYILAKNKTYERKKDIWTADTGVSAEIYSFLGRRWIYSVGANRIWLPSGAISNEKFSVRGESHVFVRFGYFFPELRALAGEFFY